MKMTSLFTNVFAIAVLLSGMFLMVLIMHLMLKYRDHTVKLRSIANNFCVFPHMAYSNKFKTYSLIYWVA
jgi:hypothetical protein